MHNHHHCLHLSMVYCRDCRAAYCKACGKEWRDPGYTWTWTAPNYWLGTTTAGVTMSNLLSSQHVHS